MALRTPHHARLSQFHIILQTVKLGAQRAWIGLHMHNSLLSLCKKTFAPYADHRLESGRRSSLTVG